MAERKPPEPAQKGLLSRNWLLGAVIALAAIIAGAVYVMQTGYGNQAGQTGDQTAGSCGGSEARIAALEGLNTGELAAFQLADTPQYVGDLAFNDGEGNRTNLADHRGQTVLLNLWATWCAPCREEMPELDALQGELGGEDFVVLPVSVDIGDDVKPKGFYAETGLKHLPFRHDGTMGVFNNLKKKSLAIGMPTTLLVDGEGCVLGHLAGPAAWASEDAKALVGAAVGK